MNTPEHTERRIQGVALSPGVAIGIPCFLNTPVDALECPKPDPTVGHEQQRLVEGLGWLADRIRDLAHTTQRRLGDEAAEIFHAHRMIVEDPVLRDELFAVIHQEKIRAEVAVARHLESYEMQLRQSPQAYLRERADDIAALKDRLVAHLSAAPASKHCVNTRICDVGACPGRHPHVLVARELTPSLTIETDQLTVGFAVEHGGRTSHAAILARALGLPAVSGIKDTASLTPETLLILDGDSGELIINPTPETLALAKARAQGPREAAVPAVQSMRVYANIDGMPGVAGSLRALAEGVGLYRTELEVMREGRLLSEDEQAQRYAAVLSAMGELPVYIRLLDIGADKIGRWLQLPHEDNPALGLRGARLLMTRPDVLRPQARALARAARHRRVRVIYPMIIDAAQFLELKALFNEAIVDLPGAQLSHGVMFEVPSACLNPGPLMDAADFGCVGTNDLIQYLFAADRANEGINSDALSRHPALWAVLASLASAARTAGKPLSVCGELASDPEVTRKFIELGVHALSVSPEAIGAVRRAAVS